MKNHASTLAEFDRKEPNMWWKRGSNSTVLTYFGHDISLDGLRRCQGALEDATRKLMQETLLLGLHFPVDFPSLVDDVSNTEPGYSLFLDPANREALGPLDQLAQAILDSPELRKRFVVSVDGLKITWRADELSRWLDSYSSLDRLCLVQLEMNCGAPGRTTELTGLTAVNTSTGVCRALREMDGGLVMVRVYVKTRARDGYDRFIPHSINASLATTLIYKEAVCRPFTQICASVLFPNDQEIKAMYQDNLFIKRKKAFDADDISKTMKTWTEEYLGYGLTISDWRQVSTPLRRVHAGMAESLMDEQEETVNAAQAGHSQGTDHAHYGRTERTVTGLAEGYLGPFLENSLAWHETLLLVPGKRGEFLPRV